MPLHSKKAQVGDNPIIIFAIIVIALLFLAPIVLKLMNDVKTPVSNSFGNMSRTGGDIAKTNFDSVMNTGINMWDKVIVFAFFVAVFLLFISAFLIDAHPFFIIIYIMMAFLLVLFAPNIIDAVDKVYDAPQFATEVSQLSFMDWIRSHYGEMLVGMIVITGIIIYGKLRFFTK